VGAQGRRRLSCVGRGASVLPTADRGKQLSDAAQIEGHHPGPLPGRQACDKGRESLPAALIRCQAARKFCTDAWIVADQTVVGLRAKPGRGPVGAPGQVLSLSHVISEIYLA
jgi:hypothetical protein